MLLCDQHAQGHRFGEPDDQRRIHSHLFLGLMPRAGTGSVPWPD
jgi:hypothetical protein